MTAILVTEDLTIHTDSQVSDGWDNFVGDYEKIHLVGHLVVAGTGRRVIKTAFLHALEKQIKTSPNSTYEVLMNSISELDLKHWKALVLDTHSKILYYVATGGVADVLPPIAIGGGEREVLAAYLACGDVNKSFAVASKLDLQVGGPVQSYIHQEAT
ncbi:hypothetical protein K0504_09755 [Neiella marina]|uniref:Uncharacterized protein n=1 Tax=Neiella holothuriorum TaxID=2870530 RepID=A0ABS7EHU1_9GAMM|nr:hypothetical protein [Neiella holothuriorum]MBW8191321.1 hypothetical protein [Neiella holothuriorum]